MPDPANHCSGQCTHVQPPMLSAPPQMANELYENFVEEIKNYGIPTQTGKFAAMMDVELINDGPVTFMLEG